MSLSAKRQEYQVKKGQICFAEDNSESFRAINVKLGANICLGSVQMPVDFGVVTLIPRSQRSNLVSR